MGVFREFNRDALAFFEHSWHTHGDHFVTRLGPLPPSASVASREAASDFYERHPDWTGSAPVTVAHYPDYFERHPELSSRVSSSVDLTDYYFRHIDD